MAFREFPDSPADSRRLGMLDNPSPAELAELSGAFLEKLRHELETVYLFSLKATGWWKGRREGRRSEAR
jgi:hypothetical protein